MIAHWRGLPGWARGRSAMRQIGPVRRLGAGDEEVLAGLARDEADFDLEGRGGPRSPLDPAAAAAYLADPAVLHWVAEEDGAVVGHLLCLVLPRRCGDARELLL